jgi:mono/diheme cytochrome c family protein
MKKWLALASLSAAVIASGMLATAQEQSATSDPAPPIHARPASPASGPADPAPTDASKTSPKGASPGIADERGMRIEGEKRFRTNCGRCHMAPRKFSPRTMATVIRHMRVRAMITDEDMRLILRYMTQ